MRPAETVEAKWASALSALFAHASFLFEKELLFVYPPKQGLNCT